MINSVAGALGDPEHAPLHTLKAWRTIKGRLIPFPQPGMTRPHSRICGEDLNAELCFYFFELLLLIFCNLTITGRYVAEQG